MTIWLLLKIAAGIVVVACLAIGFLAYAEEWGAPHDRFKK